VLEHRNTTKRETEHLATLERALADFRELRAGSAGMLAICPRALDLATDLLIAPRRIWENVTPYTVTRHAKGVGAFEAVRRDLVEEIRRRGLPEAEVAVDDVRGIAKEGVVARLRLVFRVAVSGPILLGRSRHLGGGLFAHWATKTDS
jgi:CRISPR-associated protein Csb2